VDLGKVSQGIREVYADKVNGRGLKPMRIFTECGRMVTGPFGFLVTRANHVESKHRDYVGVDACMADLMRPGMYGAYHHITVLGKEDQPATHKVDVKGSLCENNDKFAVDRMLPDVEPGDLLVIHDTGAHGRAMCFNYNGKLRSGELLLRPDGSVQMIRRPETAGDYFATFDFPGSKFSALRKS
jgi:diaminopimelate decarboxylase